jgi:Holliday junction resolvasome RuvABC DNA-binding subunit
MNLGYSLPEAQKAVDRVVRERNETDLGRLISAALQEI